MALKPVGGEQVASVQKHMKVGSLDIETRRMGVILGVDLARGLGCAWAKKVALITPPGYGHPAGVSRVKSFTVTGLFEIGWILRPTRVALIHVADARLLSAIGRCRDRDSRQTA